MAERTVRSGACTRTTVDVKTRCCVALASSRCACVIMGWASRRGRGVGVFGWVWVGVSSTLAGPGPRPVCRGFSLHHSRGRPGQRQQQKSSSERTARGGAALPGRRAPPHRHRRRTLRPSVLMPTWLLPEPRQQRGQTARRATRASEACAQAAPPARGRAARIRVAQWESRASGVA